MKMKTLVGAVGLALSSSAALGNSYQIEASANYTHNDVDGGGSDGSFGARAEYHLAPVQTRNHPLAEAAFLEQSTNVYAEANDDFDVLSIGGEAYMPDGWLYVGAEIQRVSNGDTDTTVTGTFGITPIDGLLVSTSVTDDGYDANLRGKYVADLGGGNYVNLEGRFQERDFDDYLRLDADFYINRTWSVGAGYADNYGDEFTLRTRRFFNDDISGEVAFTDTDYGSRIMVGGAIRF